MSLIIPSKPAFVVPGTIFERKIVAEGNGQRAEWRRVQNEDGLDEWRPFLVNQTTGEVINEPAWLPLPGSQWSVLECPVFECLYHGERGPGKRILNTEPILTDSGWKKVGDVKITDRLVAVDGSYTKILGIYPQDTGKMYKVTFDDDASIVVDEDHLWAARNDKNGYKYINGWVVLSTKQLLERKGIWHIPTITSPVPGKLWDGPDPYVVGQLLGDGTMRGAYPTLYSADEWTKDYMINAHGWKAYRYDRAVWMLQETRKAKGDVWRNTIGNAKGVDKKVPQTLMDADPESRLAVLQGLMDSDGSVEKNNKCRFVSLSFHLAHDVQYLVRSLGGKSRCYWEDRPSPKGGVDGRWRVTVLTCGKFNPFRLPRKAERVNHKHGIYRRIVSIIPVEDGAATCFEVDHPRHLFVVKDFIVTHNTLTLIMDFVREIGKGFGSSWRGGLFRREYKDLDDVVKKLDEWMPKLFGNKYRFLHSKSEYRAEWDTGEMLLIRALEGVEAYPSFHGQELPWLGFEELTQWEDPDIYLMMQSCCRSAKRGIPVRVRSTTNPFGCVPYGEVLTPDRGWVDISLMQIGDAIVSMQKNGTAFETEISGVIHAEYSGEMVYRKGRGLSLAFTPEHRFAHLNTAQDAFTIKHFYDLPGEAYLKRTADGWDGKALEAFTVPEFKTRKLRLDQPSTLAGLDYAEFMGWFLSEGCVIDRDKSFQIAQNKLENREIIQKLLNRCGFVFRIDDQGFVICSPKWWSYLSQFGKSREKFVPLNLKRADISTLISFFESVMAGDGHWMSEESGSYYTISKRLADDMAEIGVKLGYRVYVSNRQRKNREGFSYTVSFSKAAPIQLHTGNHQYDVDTTDGSVNVERKQFNGMVHCITVPESETFFIRQDGCVWLSGNSGHNWVKKRWQLPHKSGRIIREPGQMPRTSVFGSLHENFLLLHAQPDYLTILKNSSKNPAQIKAWLEGDWNVTSGGMFDDLWRQDVHVLPSFGPGLIPRGWRLTRSYDHGQSHPFAVGWWLESNGEPFEFEGRIIGSVRGDLILWKEWYGSTGEPNVGLRMNSRTIARGIVDREQDEGIWGRVKRGPADTEIFNKISDRDGKSPADDMELEKIFWDRADKSSGSRKRGWELIRTRLQNAVPQKDGTREEPGLFVCDRCVNWIELCPIAPRDTSNPDEIPEKYEDHPLDMTRYRLNYVESITTVSDF